MDDKLSSLVDGELEADEASEAVQMLLNNSDFQDRWHRYHVMKSAIHNDLPGHHNVDITRQVSFALQREPTVLAPEPKPRSAFDNMAKPLAGLAIAATVAMVTLVGVDLLSNRTPLVDNIGQVATNLMSRSVETPVQSRVASMPGSSLAPEPSVVTPETGNVNVNFEPSAGEAEQVASQVVDLSQSESVDPNVSLSENSGESQVDVDARLKAYLVIHSQFSSRLQASVGEATAGNSAPEQ